MRRMWQRVIQLAAVGMLSAALGFGWVSAPVGQVLPGGSTLGGDPGSGGGGG